jgi:hypothetical protein
MSDRRRFFIPQQVTGGWQLYGLSSRHLVRLLPVPLVLFAGTLLTVLFWRLVPEAGKFRLVLRGIYCLFPFGFGSTYVGLFVIPIDAGRTLWDIRQMKLQHLKQQTVFLPRNQIPPQ